MSKRGKLIIFTGPSGCGKGTILKEWLATRDDTLISVSVTTRAPRPGEIDGVHYHFLSREVVETMAENGELLEFAEYSGNIYGTPLPPIEAWLDEGKNVILEIEVQGAEKVMQKRPDALSIFIVPPSFEELERRLRGRGTETEENVVRRLAASLTEIPVAKLYQYIICNDTLSDAVKRLDAVVAGEM